MMKAMLFLAIQVVVVSYGTLSPLQCDVLVAGGSTAALSASITAAVANSTLIICLTEPTTTLGGQLAYNPAIDYGDMPRLPGLEWRSVAASVTPAHSPCWVSKSCYPPSRLADWINKRMATLGNLHVLYRTTVRSAVRDHASGRVTGLQLVTRTPKTVRPREEK